MIERDSKFFRVLFHTRYADEDLGGQLLRRILKGDDIRKGVVLQEFFVEGEKESITAKGETDISGFPFLFTDQEKKKLFYSIFFLYGSFVFVSAYMKNAMDHYPVQLIFKRNIEFFCILFYSGNTDKDLTTQERGPWNGGGVIKCDNICKSIVFQEFFIEGK